MNTSLRKISLSNSDRTCERSDGPRAVTRFVIIAAPRTGSNWLCSLLDSHDDILCHHEIFNPERVIEAFSWRKANRRLGDREERERDPIGFLRRIWDWTNGEQCIGFKLNRDQNPTVFDHVLDDASIKKILVTRRNRLRTFVSETIAKKTDQWESYPWSQFEQNSTSIEVCLEDLWRHVEENEAYYSKVRNRAEAAGNPVHEIVYECLGNEEEQIGLMEFLSAGLPKQSLKGMTTRLNPAPLRTLVDNFSEVARALQKTELKADLHD